MSSAAEGIAGRSYLTVIVRLVLDSQRRIERGDLVDTEGHVEERFVGIEGLVRAIEHVLAADGGHHAGG